MDRTRSPGTRPPSNSRIPDDYSTEAHRLPWDVTAGTDRLHGHLPLGKNCRACRSYHSADGYRSIEELVQEVPKLVHHENADCVEFTSERLDQLVETIVSWYDSVEAAWIA